MAACVSTGRSTVILLCSAAWVCSGPASHALLLRPPLGPAVGNPLVRSWAAVGGWCAGAGGGWWIFPLWGCVLPAWRAEGSGSSWLTVRLLGQGRGRGLDLAGSCPGSFYINALSSFGQSAQMLPASASANYQLPAALCHPPHPCQPPPPSSRRMENALLQPPPTHSGTLRRATQKNTMFDRLDAPVIRPISTGSLARLAVEEGRVFAGEASPASILPSRDPPRRASSTTRHMRRREHAICQRMDSQRSFVAARALPARQRETYFRTLFSSPPTAPGVLLSRDGGSYPLPVARIQQEPPSCPSPRAQTRPPSPPLSACLGVSSPPHQSTRGGPICASNLTPSSHPGAQSKGRLTFITSEPLHGTAALWGGFALLNRSPRPQGWPNLAVSPLHPVYL